MRYHRHLQVFRPTCDWRVYRCTIFGRAFKTQSAPPQCGMWLRRDTVAQNIPVCGCTQHSSLCVRRYPDCTCRGRFHVRSFNRVTKLRVCISIAHLRRGQVIEYVSVEFLRHRPALLIHHSLFSESNTRLDTGHRTSDLLVCIHPYGLCMSQTHTITPRSLPTRLPNRQ